MLALLTPGRFRRAAHFWKLISTIAVNQVRMEDIGKKLLSRPHGLQILSVDNDVRELKRAIILGESDLRSGNRRVIETGPKCQVCGQSGVAYRHDGQTRILVCSNVEKAMSDVLLRTNYSNYREALRYKFGYYPFESLNGLRIADCPIESVKCGKNLKMHLRMRYCWFD